MKMAVFWVVAPCRLIDIALMMEAVQISETSVNSYQSTRRCNLEDSHLHVLTNVSNHYKTEFRQILSSEVRFAYADEGTPQTTSLFAGFRSQRTGSSPASLHVAFVVEKVALASGQFFSSSRSVFPCQYHSTAAKHSLIYHLGDGQRVR
jgi:hypothetical protein